MSYMFDYTKLVYRPDLCLKWLYGKWDELPVWTVEVSPTTRCNLHCPYCPFKPWQKASHNDLFARGVPEGLKFEERPPYSVSIAGEGEPLLAPNLEAFVLGVLAEKKIPYGVTSNGTAKLPRWLKKYPPVWFRVSCHEQAGKVAETLLNLPDQTTKGVVFVATRKNFNWIKRVIPHLKHADYISIKPIRPDPALGDTSELELTEAQEQELLLQQGVFKQVHVYANSFKAKWLGEKPRACYAFWAYCFITAKGDVYTCAQDAIADVRKAANVKHNSWPTVMHKRIQLLLPDSPEQLGPSTDRCVVPCRLHASNLYLQEVKWPSPSLHLQFL